MDNEIESLLIDIKNSMVQLKIDDLVKRLEELKISSAQADFWKESDKAAAIMQEIAKLEQRTTPWIKILDTAEDLLELIRLNDPNLEEDIKKDFSKAVNEFDNLKKQLMFSGDYDDHGVVMSVYAGAGGGLMRKIGHKYCSECT